MLKLNRFFFFKTQEELNHVLPYDCECIYKNILRELCVKGPGA